MNPPSHVFELVVDLVLPHPKQGPTVGTENPVGTPISFNIPREVSIPDSLFLPQHYTLEISGLPSCGLDRPLLKPDLLRLLPASG